MSAKSVFTSLDIRENIAALTIAILSNKPITAEDAFDMFDRGERAHRKSNVQTETLIKMKESGMKRSDIAEATGLRPRAVGERIRRYNNKIKEEKECVNN